jgi:hypothetical protein
MAVAPDNSGSATPFIFGNANPNKQFVGPVAGPPKSIAPPKTTPAAPKKPVAVNRKPSPAVGSNSTGAISPTAPVQPNVDEWLANDVAYRTQSNQLAKAWADYQAQSKQTENQYRTDYTSKQSELGKTRELAGQELEADYASRGMLGSGLYAKAYTDYSTDYDNRQKQLDTGLSDFLANLLSQTNNYKSEQDIASEKAKQDAIARRAASMGV